MLFLLYSTTYLQQAGHYCACININSQLGSISVSGNTLTESSDLLIMKLEQVLTSEVHKPHFNNAYYIYILSAHIYTQHSISDMESVVVIIKHIPGHQQTWCPHGRMMVLIVLSMQILQSRLSLLVSRWY